ncbi:Stalked cell differentiation-controlling protein (plasmid) [Tsukamurella tyrosinosolvens]|uniref:PAS domain S-box-containing protein/diguanylate cyclase (GGDEF) domain-containing protein n=1 Tax=Tsukamurella tyrosinosolvens TaxID=57704 RepID=A0A1H4QSB5_TSUTY|nr:PAS domain S-box-containing protein/diguanylate cyclase (GGDEF) domain-containing protein [Tsukamurella tyrosinosolvens]VEH92473.1 Stalked cell differentiation-controlling protein [Tsukamurella tyrosinosolvens]
MRITVEPVSGNAHERDDGAEVRYLRERVAALTAEVDEARRSLPMFRAIAAAATDLIYVKDLAGRYLFVNDAVARLYGVRVADFVGNDDRQMFDAAAASQLRETDREIMRSGVAQELEESTTVDGLARTFLSTKSPYRDAAGEVIGLIGVSRDITDARSTAEEVARLRALQAAATAAATGDPDRAADLATFRTFQAIADAAPDSVYVKDREGRFVFLNRAALRVLQATELPIGEVLGSTDDAFLDAPAAARIMGADQEVMATGIAQEVDESAVVDGRPRTVRSLKAPYRDESGRVIGLVGVSRDVTASRQLEARLLRAEARWQFALDTVGEGIWDWDLPSREVYYSPRWKSMLGYADDEIGDTTLEWERRVHPEDLESALRAMNRHMRGETAEYNCEHRIRTRSGYYLWVRGRGRVIERGEDGTIVRIIGSQTDVTAEVIERRALQDAAEELGRLAEIDELTGIANRRGFTRALEAALRDASESGDVVHLALIDVDGFKTYNDTHGHVVGDHVLRELAAVIARIPSRRGEVAARYGGDELALLLVGDVDLAAVLESARRDILALGLAPNGLPVSVSIGGVSATAATTAPGLLLHEADRRLYRAKADGRNRVVAG